MVSSLLAGIRALLANSREGLMPESLTRRESAYVNLWGVRLHVGMGVRLQLGTVSGITSESRPASSRSRVRHRLGISGRHQSESAGPPAATSFCDDCH